MREVLANLVANALRYVRPGGTVRIGGRSTAEGIALEVVDDGPGIPAELLPTVFDRFAKSSDSRGSGLGLAIARAIVESHGGRIAAESPRGRRNDDQDRPAGPLTDRRLTDPLVQFPLRGAIAQLGERLHGIQKVRGSSPRSSTSERTPPTPTPRRRGGG